MNKETDAEYVDHFRERVLQDALNEATHDYWLRRAEQFEAAMHKPGDFAGPCDVDTIAENNSRLADKARACRQRATLAIFLNEPMPTLEGVA